LLSPNGPSALLRHAALPGRARRRWRLVAGLYHGPIKPNGTLVVLHGFTIVRRHIDTTMRMPNRWYE
jgi:hypothetical protein